MPKIWLLSTARILRLLSAQIWGLWWNCNSSGMSYFENAAALESAWNLREDDLKQEIGKNVNQFFRSAPRSFRFHPPDTMCRWTSGLLVSEMSIVFLKYCFKSCIEPWGDSCYQTGCGFSNKHSEHVPSLTIPLSVHVPVYPERKRTFREKIPNNFSLKHSTLNVCLTER